MALSNEQQQAIAMLNKVLETQPEVVSKTGNRSAGEDAANFCIQFINTYSTWLESQKK